MLAHTLGRLKTQRVGAHLLPFWYDVDEAGDLERLVWHVRALRRRAAGSFSHTWGALADIGLVRRDDVVTP
jgi:hypothetical protein